MTEFVVNATREIEGKVVNVSVKVHSYDQRASAMFLGHVADQVVLGLPGDEPKPEAGYFHPGGGMPPVLASQAPVAAGETSGELAAPAASEK